MPYYNRVKWSIRDMSERNLRIVLIIEQFNLRLQFIFLWVINSVWFVRWLGRGDWLSGSKTCGQMTEQAHVQPFIGAVTHQWSWQWNNWCCDNQDSTWEAREHWVVEETYSNPKRTIGQRRHTAETENTEKKRVRHLGENTFGFSFLPSHSRISLI